MGVTFTEAQRYLLDCFLYFPVNDNFFHRSILSNCILSAFFFSLQNIQQFFSVYLRGIVFPYTL